MHVAIIGGGIGGLTTALSLHAAGIGCDVYESAPEIRPLGVGINLLPHAVRELTELGLANALAGTAIETESLIYANRFGQEIWREARGTGAGYRWPQFSIHRGALQMILLDAVRSRIGAARVHTGAQAVRVGASSVAFHSGKIVETDVIVAADGIHSAIRAQFYPREGPPKWNRRVLWRGVTEGLPFLGGRTMVMAGYENQKFVCYPISREAETRGRSLINWVAELSIAGVKGWRREDWNRPGSLRDFLPNFANWHFGWLDVPAVIRGASHIYEYPMVDRDPVGRWTFDRVTLLGDAAHPMYPIGSNGASQAILDARILAHALATSRSTDAGLALYEESRRPGTGRLVLANRANGPEQVMQTVHERAPNGFTDISDVMSRDELESAAGRYKQIAGFDRDALNARESLSVR
ncbi:MAG TPA: flavin-dependent oxidoreductase [Rhizomicrobium sp.]|nr:flavin-dependent oxidoreductase [Rhizomicrobium sp.]